MPTTRSMFLLAPLAGLAGCLDADLPEQLTGPPAAPPPVAVHRAVLTPALPILVSGSTVRVSGVGFRADGSMWPGPASWTTSDPAVLAADGSAWGLTTIRALSPGRADLVLTVGGLRHVHPLQVVPRPSAPTDPADAPVEVIDVRASWRPSGYLVPSLRLRSRAAAVLTVAEVWVALDGTPPLPSCRSAVVVGQDDLPVLGMSRYGDELLGYAVGSPAPADSATVSFIVADPDGRTWRVDQRVRIDTQAPILVEAATHGSPWSCP